MYPYRDKNYANLVTSSVDYNADVGIFVLRRHASANPRGPAQRDLPGSFESRISSVRQLRPSDYRPEYSLSVLSSSLHFPGKVAIGRVSRFQEREENVLNGERIAEI